MGGGGDMVSLVKGPKEAYHSLAEKGALTAKDSSITVFAQSFMAGCYIGFGALLATAISERLPGATEDNPGLKTFVFAALFPVNLLLILLSGGILFTGTSAAGPAAVYEGKARVIDVARILALSWLGNVLGSFAFAVFTDYGCELNTEATAAGAAAITKKKTSKGFFTTFFKGIGCNWMVCMAVFLCGQAQDMVGKYLGIWFPISTFVMIGFEHIPANFYITILGLMANQNDVTFADVVLKNWIPTTLGNFVAGAFIIAGGYSFIFGRLGQRTTLDSAPAIDAAAARSMGFNADAAKASEGKDATQAQQVNKDTGKDVEAGPAIESKEEILNC